MYQNFKIATYPHAVYLSGAQANDVQAALDFFCKHLSLSKVYLETHRGSFDISCLKMKEFRSIFEANGIEVGGAICPSLHLKGHEKNNFSDVICFTDPAVRAHFMELVRKTASLFDEILLDDFFFTNCKCEMCIDAKADKSWAEYRMQLMESVSREMCEEARKVNPRCQMIIKFPNWYENYAQNGYQPRVQREIFDRVYTGVEARNPKYDAQHVQRYLSYSNYRRISNMAGGKNAGAWFDEGGSNDDTNVWLEQASFALFAGAKELTVCRDWLSFPYPTLVESPIHPALGVELERIDRLVGQLGTPIGIPVYEPFNTHAEGQLINYLGMIGVPFEPVAEFPEDTQTVFLTASAAEDPNFENTFQNYIRQGGYAVVTSGFVAGLSEVMREELFPCHISDARAAGSLFWADNYEENHRSWGKTEQALSFPIVECAGSWTEAGMMNGSCGCSLLTENHYGKGTIFVLSVPDAYDTFYKLPSEVLTAIRRVCAKALPVYLRGGGKYSVFLYQNNTLGVFSHRPYECDVELVLRKAAGSRLRDLETGEILESMEQLPGASARFDSAQTPELDIKQLLRFSMLPGTYRFFSIEQ